MYASSWGKRVFIKEWLIKREKWYLGSRIENERSGRQTNHLKCERRSSTNIIMCYR